MVERTPGPPDHLKTKWRKPFVPNQTSMRIVACSIHASDTLLYLHACMHHEPWSFACFFVMLEGRGRGRTGIEGVGSVCLTLGSTRTL